MRIGISAPFRMHGGSEVFVRHLLRAWSRTGVDREHSVTLITSQSNVEALGDALGDRVALRPVPYRQENLLARMAWEQVGLPRRLGRKDLDVVLCPGNMSPLGCPIPSVVMFRNAAPFCESVTLRSAGFYDWTRYRTIGTLMRASARRATRVIFISRYFRDLFTDRFGFPAARADVVYNGRDGLSFDAPTGDLLRALDIRRPYFLSVGHLYHYKRFPKVVEGWALSQRARADGRQLVFVGGTLGSPDHAQIVRAVRASGVGDSIRIVGVQPHSTIGPLIAGCDGFVFQSTCENCPNALIEALAAGVPIACSNAGVMPEIAGDAAVYYDPSSPHEIARALDRIAAEDGSRAELRALARAQSLRFPTWDEVGRQVLASLVRAVSGSAFDLGLRPSAGVTPRADGATAAAAPSPPSAAER